jgi:hypothetical protein
MFDSHPPSRNDLVLGFLLVSEFLPTRFLVWLRDLYARERKANKAKILKQFAPFW